MALRRSEKLTLACSTPSMISCAIFAQSCKPDTGIALHSVSPSCRTAPARPTSGTDCWVRAPLSVPHIRLH